MTKRIILGKKGTTFGLWVSKVGFNVDTADANDCLLNMDSQPSAVVYRGTIGDTATQIGATRYYEWTYAHGLGFTPAFLVNDENATAPRSALWANSSYIGFTQYYPYGGTLPATMTCDGAGLGFVLFNTAIV